jgi:hypothetical protein
MRRSCPLDYATCPKCGAFMTARRYAEHWSACRATARTAVPTTAPWVQTGPRRCLDCGAAIADDASFCSTACEQHYVRMAGGG